MVPFAAGGTTDVLGRLIGQRLSVALGQPVVVENRAGAGGNIGSDYVAKAAPDGYTLVGGTISSHAINVSLYPRMPYDPVKQFQPVALIGTLPNVLVVNADSPWKSVQDVIAAARVPGTQVTFGSSGNGTSQHLAGELFAKLADVKLLHVPYKGSSPAMQALLGKQVDLVFENSVAAMPLIQSGKLRALAPAASAPASCPTCPRWRRPGSRATRSSPGRPSSRRPARRHRWWTASPARSARSSPTRPCVAAWPSSASSPRVPARPSRRLPEGRGGKVGPAGQERRHPARMSDRGSITLPGAMWLLAASCGAGAAGAIMRVRPPAHSAPAASGRDRANPLHCATPASPPCPQPSPTPDSPPQIIP